MSSEVTHKVVKSTGTNHGMNYTPKTSKLFMKAGTQSEMLQYMYELQLRAKDYAKEDISYGEPKVTRSKNTIHFNNHHDESVLFELVKLGTKEWRKYNEN